MISRHGAFGVLPGSRSLVVMLIVFSVMFGGFRKGIQVEGLGPRVLLLCLCRPTQL